MDDQQPSAAARLTWLPAVSLLMAAVVGVVHGLFSLYWAVGGDWLISTLGDRIVDVFAGRRWLLFPVAVIKVGFAMLPLVLLARGWPLRRLSRLVCWLGTVGLVLWGGINTVTGNLVLSGLIRPAAGYDRPGMVGHAWLWDPLFLIWGITVTIGLLSTRGNTNTYVTRGPRLTLELHRRPIADPASRSEDVGPSFCPCRALRFRRWSHNGTG